MDINKRIDEMKNDIVNSVQEIVKIRSLEGEPKPNKPFGEEVDNALQCALEISKKLGFKTVNVDGYAGYAEYGDGEEYVAALGHIDLVPEGDDWIHPPYGAEIHDGKIYGRGTTDDKGPIIACLYGLKAIKDLGLPLSKKIRIIFGTNEETGGEDIPYYLQKEPAPVAAFTPDADFPIINGEKGITIFDLVKEFSSPAAGEIVIESIIGGNAANMVPDYAEALLTCKNTEEVVEKLKKFASENNYDMTSEINDSKLKIKSKGVSGHGSTPELGKNAIMQLIVFLASLDLSDDDLSNYIKFLGEKIGMDLYGEKFGIYLEDKESGKLSFNVGKININENKGIVTLNLRYPVTKTLDDMMKPVNKTLEGTGITIENFSHQEPLYFSPDHPLIQSLAKVYNEQTGKKSELISIGGGTYAKEMPNTVAFGPIFPGEPCTIHQPNEYIEIEDLINITKIYAHSLYELAK
ncbi:dipeptidase PepV [Clostridium butanoliproducens]|uniref:dipeptidase PepV n=1 Tax=Clostridium butanoliproducens TaxID=2991837 RepID=UPI0024B902A1|nr:dipeptidase PepV [Clostridium butanoliproducens]MDU1349319.1 dipeptidase PepV [Clostridium argentinense]